MQADMFQIDEFITLTKGKDGKGTQAIFHYEYHFGRLGYHICELFPLLFLFRLIENRRFRNN